MLYANATCRFMEPLAEVNATDKQRRERGYETHTEELRCSMKAMSAEAAITAFGRIVLRGYTCRLVTTLDVRPEWRISVKVDGEDAWREYAIATARKGHYLTLTLEGVG